MKDLSRWYPGQDLNHILPAYKSEPHQPTVELPTFSFHTVLTPEHHLAPKKVNKVTPCLRVLNVCTVYVNWGI